jgi:Rhomboid family
MAGADAAAAERQQLRWLAVGLTLIGGAFSWGLGPRPFPLLLLGLAALAWLGTVAHRAMGRTVFLLFTLVSLTLGRVVSWVVVLALYVLAIGVLGSIFKLFGMNRLERDFEACRRKTTMLVDVPPLDPAGLRRQS